MKKITVFAGLLAMPLWALAQQDQQSQSMPGMDMGQPKQPPAAERQLLPGMQMSPAPGGDAQPVTQPSLTLQEPENPRHQTGSAMPAPELLTDVIKRPPIALNEFLTMADRNNPTIRQAQELVARSAEQARQAGLYPNPSAGYQGEQIRGGSYGGGEQGGYVQQTVVLGGKLGLRRNIYEQQQGSDRIGVEEQTYRVHNDVTQAFYTAMTAQAMVVVRQRLLRLTEDSVATAHQLANVGQVDAPDILQAEVELEQAQIDFVDAQRSYIQSFRVLAACANKPDLPVSPLAGEFDQPPAYDAEQQVDTIVQNSPTVKRAQQEVAVAEARLRDAGREAIPDLQLRVGEQYNGETVATDPHKSVGAQSFAGAGIDIPLWNRNQGNIGAAKAELERAQQDVVRTRLYLKQQAEPLAQSYLTAQFTAQRYRDELIPRARRAYELYLMKYRQMAMAYPQVLVSQRTLFQLQIGYLQSLQSVWTTRTALENYTLQGGLRMPVSSGTASTTINLPNGGGSE